MNMLTLDKTELHRNHSTFIAEAVFAVEMVKADKQLEKQNGFGRIYNGLRIQKTLDFLRDSASITEVDPDDTKE